MRVENLVCRCFYNRCDLCVNVEKINSTRVLIDGISLNTTNFVLFLSGFTTHFSNFITFCYQSNAFQIVSLFFTI